MKSEILIKGYELLVLLDDNENISFTKLENLFEIKGSELRELLKYLKEKEYISWRHPPRIFTLETFGSVNFDKEDEIKLNHKGMEVVLGQRDYFTEMAQLSQKILNEINIHGDQNQIAQGIGDNFSIDQVQDNSKIKILNNSLKKIMS